MQITIADPAEMEAFGGRLAAAVSPGTRIHLSGELGAGKTTLVRGFLAGLGHRGKVKSPTYTLVEPYALAGLSVFHFDFYRVRDPAEVEAIGFRDYPGPDVICLIEWPEMAGDQLGRPDLQIAIGMVDGGRRLDLLAGSGRGRAALAALTV